MLHIIISYLIILFDNQIFGREITTEVTKKKMRDGEAGRQLGLTILNANRGIKSVFKRTKLLLLLFFLK